MAPILLLACYGCSSNYPSTKVGDSEVEEELIYGADGDLEEAETTDEIFDEELFDSEEEIVEDGETSVEEVDESLVDPDEDQISEAEEITEVDEYQEFEESPEAAAIILRDMPWDGVTVEPCKGDDAKASLRFIFGVWEDSAGTTYFGGARLWKFTDLPSQKLVCEPLVNKEIISMTGRELQGTIEVWLGHNGAISIYSNGAWNVLPLPEAMLTQSSDIEQNNVTDLEFAGALLSVRTKEKLGLYNPQTQEWRIVTNCPDTLNKYHGPRWDGSRLWVSAGVSLYTINLAAATCEFHKTVIEQPGTYEEIGILNADKNGVLWLGDIELAFKALMTYDGVSLRAINLPVSNEAGAEALSMGHGMSGEPLLCFQTYFFDNYYEPGSLCTSACVMEDKLLMADNHLMSDKIESLGQCLMYVDPVCKFSRGLLSICIYKMRRMLIGSRHIWVFIAKDSLNMLLNTNLKEVVLP